MFLHQHSVDFNLKTEACFPPRPMHADQVDGRNELLFSLPVCLKTEFQIKTCEYTPASLQTRIPWKIPCQKSMSLVLRIG